MKSILGLLSLMIALPVIAETPTSEYGIIGLSGSYGNSVFTTDESASIGVTPNLFYSGELGFIDGSLLNYSVLPYLGVSANWRFAEVSNSADDIPDGINDRDGNPELGITLGTAGARITYLHDVVGEHSGQEIQLHLGRTFETPLDKFLITPFVEVDWRDKNLSQHLYGINGTESISSGLERFDADSSWVYKTGIIGLYDITENWVLFNQVRIEHHDSNSALIQRDLGWSAEIGLVYKFLGN